MKFKPRSLACHGFSLVLLAVSCLAQDEEEVPDVNAPVKQLGGGALEVGGVRVDKSARTISFPAAVNMNGGNIEYLLVAKGGKTHESLFVTDIKPYYIHLAMLLLGAKGNPRDPSLEKKGPPPSAIDRDYLKSAPELKGDEVTLFVKWKNGGQERMNDVADFVINQEEKAPMRHGPWMYNGSMFYHGKFLAQLDGSIAAMVTDPEALINNRQPGHDNDTIWEVDPARTPAVNTPVTLTITLAEKHF